MDVPCIICKEKLGLTDVATVSDKGRKALVLASFKRGDGLHEVLKKTSPLRLHVACRNNYTRQSTITAEKRKSPATLIQDEETPQLRSGVSTFDIKRDYVLFRSYSC